MQARVDLALGDGVAAESEIARARAVGRAGRRDRAICSPMPGCSRAIRRARWTRPRRRRAGHARLCRPDPRPRLAGARRQWRAAQPHSTARSPLAPHDSEVWTDVARFRRASGDVAGALEAADRAVAARPAQRRGADPARRADPQPVWPRRLPALVRPGARGRSRQSSPPCSSAPSPMAISAGWPTCSPTPATSTASPAAIPPLITCRRCSPPAPANFELARSLYNRTRGAFDDPPAGMLLAGRDRFRDRQCRAGGQAPRQAWSRCSPATARRAGCSPPRNGGWTTPQRRCDALRPLVDRAGRRRLQPVPDGPGPRATWAIRRRRRSISPAPLGPSPARSTALDAARRAGVRGLLRVAAGRASRRRADPGPSDLRAARPRRKATEALARARRLQAANPGAPDAHILVGDALGMTRRLRRRSRAVSPRRQPRVHRARGACG